MPGRFAERLEARVLLAAQPILNEFLASNKHTNKDEDGDSSDWVEIYNPNASGISLKGYYLTDDHSKLTEWKFPNVSLASHAYLLVWASGKDRTDPAKPLHTNFKIAEAGEYLGLVEPDGKTVASEFGPVSVSGTEVFPLQTTDVSYGVPPGGGPDNYLIPTPGAANQLASLVSTVKFDHARGLETQAFNLAMSTATKGASIRYTLDGSMPTTTSGTVYAGPIAISNTTVVHAIAYKSGFTSTAVLDESYIFPANVLKQPEKIAGYPDPAEPISNPGLNEMDTPLTYGMDPTIVNDPQYAQAALDGLSQIPTLSVGVNPGNIFGANGFYDTPQTEDGATVPMSFEFIDPNHPQQNIGVDAGISAHADRNLKRSFHIHFSNKYGPSKLDDAIFANAPFGGSSATDDFTDLILRGGNNRTWATISAPSKTTYTEDEYVRDTQIAMTGQGVHGEFVQLYINGIYWGLYNLTERPDDGFGDAYDKANGDDYFSTSQNGTSSGDDTRWRYMLNTLTKEDLSVSTNYSQMQKYLNVKEFADYLIGQWFDGVSDWPDSNYWAGGDTSKQQPFQFYAWDGEFMMDTVDRFASTPNGPWVNPDFTSKPLDTNSPITHLWLALKQSPDFMTMFTSEVTKNTTGNGALTDADMLARWNALNNSISNAIVDESARWGDALKSTGRHTYTKNGDWTSAMRTIVNDMQGADAKFFAALSAEIDYPWNISLSSKGTLLLRGTNTGDTINLKLRKDGRLVAQVGDAVRSFAPSKVKRIDIYGYGGNDAITVEYNRFEFDTAKPEVRSVYADGGAGNDTLIGGYGDDTLIGNTGNDNIEAGPGNDSVTGNGGTDFLVGGAGNDTISGNAANDSISGSSGDDLLFGGPGADNIVGGPGKDTAESDPLDRYSYGNIESII